MEPRFVHLHVHSEYSLVDGLADIKSLVRATARAGMGALAVTDRSALFSMVRFYKAAVAEGVKPVIGVDVWLRNPGDPAKPLRNKTPSRATRSKAGVRTALYPAAEVCAKDWSSAMATRMLGRAPGFVSAAHRTDRITPERTTTDATATAERRE